MKVLVINCGSSSLKYQLIDMETKSVTARIRTGSYRTKIPFESTDFKENGKENLLLISYPSTVPAVLVIRSSISVSRNVNICNS